MGSDLAGDSAVDLALERSDQKFTGVTCKLRRSVVPHDVS